MTDYLTDGPQYVQLYGSTRLMGSTGERLGTVLSPLLFTYLYSTNFQHNSQSYHQLKFSDISAVVWCVKCRQETEYIDLVASFVCDH